MAKKIWGASNLTQSEMDAFIRLVAAESPSMDADAQRNVASTIFNRMYKSGKGFHQVATKSQFEPISNGNVNKIGMDKYARTKANLMPMFSGAIGDTTNGADHFWSPKAQQASLGDGRAAVPKWHNESKVTKRDKAGHVFLNLGHFPTAGKSVNMFQQMQPAKKSQKNADPNFKIYDDKLASEPTVRILEPKILAETAASQNMDSRIADILKAVPDPYVDLAAIAPDISQGYVGIRDGNPRSYEDIVKSSDAMYSRINGVPEIDNGIQVREATDNPYQVAQTDENLLQQIVNRGKTELRKQSYNG